MQTLLSAGTYLIAKRTLQDVPEHVLASLRFLLSSAVFGIALFAVPGPRLFARADAGRFLLLGALAIPANQLLFVLGIARTTPAHAALLYSLTPLTVLLIARRALGERVGMRRIAGVVLAVLGVAVLLRARGMEGEGRPLAGDLFILVGMLAWSSYSILGKATVARHGALRSTAWAILVGTALLLPYEAWALRDFRPSQMTPAAWGGVAYLVLGTSVLSYFFWYSALRVLEASQVAVYSNLQPPTTAFLSWWLLGEPLTRGLVTGGALILAGILLAQWRARALPASAEP